MGFFFHLKAIQTVGTFSEEEISDVDTSNSCNALDQTNPVHYIQTVHFCVKMIFLYLNIYIYFNFFFRVTAGPLDYRLIKNSIQNVYVHPSQTHNLRKWLIVIVIRIYIYINKCIDSLKNIYCISDQLFN